MMTSERLCPVTAAIWATAVLMVRISQACTPQSIRMCFRPAGVFRVNKKKSPKPTRYMRTRIPLEPTVSSAEVVDGPAPGEPAFEAPLVGLAGRPLRGLAGVWARGLLFMVRFLAGACFFSGRVAFLAAM